MEIEASFSTGVIPTRDRHPRDHCKCIPDNGAKAVVCIEKWLVLVALSALLLICFGIIGHGFRMKDNCDSYTEVTCDLRKIFETPSYASEAIAAACFNSGLDCEYTAQFDVQFTLNGELETRNATRPHATSSALYEYIHGRAGSGSLIVGTKHSCYYKYAAAEVYIGKTNHDMDCNWYSTVIILGAVFGGGWALCLPALSWLFLCSPFVTSTAPAVQQVQQEK